jgi:dTDP-4-amino-4,6-dideoxygalactose transaminase
MITQKRIWLSPPHMSENEQHYIQDAFKSNWIAPTGPNIDAFESQIASFVGVQHVTALTSGTSALHLALVTLGITQGDVVLCQDLTFAASAFPIVYQGAEPIFIDSELDTWNMDPALLRKALEDLQDSGKKAAAIVVVHLYGMPAKMDEIMDIAAEFHVPVIEDAAEAIGSMHHGAKCGGIGTVGVLSFNGNKIITTSGGGAFLTRNKKLIDHARYLSTQSKGQTPYYHHLEIGFNYKMSNVLAGIGRGQMEILPERVEARRQIFNEYKKHLFGIEGITFTEELKGAFSNRWLTTILINPGLTGGVTNEEIRLELESENIESRPIWKPMHLQPVFSKYKIYTEGNASHLFDQGLCLPSGSAMTKDEVARVSTTIKNLICMKLSNLNFKHLDKIIQK